jgi:inhibitor of KinA
VFYIHALGDRAVTVRWDDFSDDTAYAHALAARDLLEAHWQPGWQELIVAYRSVTLFYDIVAVRQRNPGYTAALTVEQQIRRILHYYKPVLAYHDEDRQSLVQVPVHYDGADLAFVAAESGLSADKVIAIHTQTIYTCYFLGFLPGFAYMGWVDERIATPRKAVVQPIRAGAVGIADRQTGVYPLASPGGWQILGHTPWVVFDDARNPPNLFVPGCRVQFYAI